MTPCNADPEPKRFALGASPDCRRVTVDGVSIAYDDRGAWISHHRAACDHPWQPRLRARRRPARQPMAVHHARLARQGRSGVDPHPARLARYTDLLAGFMDALKIDRAVLIGNSIGGSAAMAYAAQFPRSRRWAGPRRSGRTDPDERTRIQDLRHDGGAWTRRPARCVLLQAGLLDDVSAVSPNARRARTAGPDCRCGRRMRRNLGAGVAGLSHAGSRSDGVGAQINCPVLFTWASRDPIVSFARSKDAIGRFPNHSVALFGGGHCPFLEEPEKFLAAVEPFLERATAVKVRSAAARSGGDIEDAREAQLRSTVPPASCEGCVACEVGPGRTATASATHRDAARVDRGRREDFQFGRLSRHRLESDRARGRLRPRHFLRSFRRQARDLSRGLRELGERGVVVDRGHPEIRREPRAQFATG